MALYMMENGWMLCVKGRVHNFGPMEASILASGRTIKQMERVYFITPILIFTRDNGWMIRQMAMELILTKMGPNILVIGEMINRMATGFRSGKMEKDTRANMWKGVRQGRAY
jgi:hypothetical protein